MSYEIRMPIKAIPGFAGATDGNVELAETPSSLTRMNCVGQVG
jgi:hypothetical protein